MNIKRFEIMIMSGLIAVGTLCATTPDPIERIEKKIRAELVKGGEKDGIAVHFDKHSKVMGELLNAYLSSGNKESHKAHLVKIMAAISLFETHIEQALRAKMTQEQTPATRESLTKAHSQLIAVLNDFKAICRVLAEYSGASDILSLAELGSKVSQWKHLLPAEIRKWDLLTWKSRLQHRMSC